MGLVPVYLWSDSIAWLPYACSSADVRKLGFVVGVDEAGFFLNEQMPKLLEDVRTLRERRAKIMAHRGTHFTPEGVVAQIHAFLRDPPTADLKCWDQHQCGLPNTELRDMNPETPSQSAPERRQHKQQQKKKKKAKGKTPRRGKDEL